MGRDPWVGNIQKPGTLHGWSYASNNPINFVDPTGMVPDAGAMTGGGSGLTRDEAMIIFAVTTGAVAVNNPNALENLVDSFVESCTAFLSLFIPQAEATAVPQAQARTAPQPQPQVTPQSTPIAVPTITWDDDDETQRIWRGISGVNPATGDFHTRKPHYLLDGTLKPGKEGDWFGLSFYDSRESIWAATLRAESQNRKPYRVGISIAVLTNNGFKIIYDSNVTYTFPNGRIEINPPGHVSVKRLDDQEWDDWLNRDANNNGGRFSILLRDLARSQGSERNVVP